MRNFFILLIIYTAAYGAAASAGCISNIPETVCSKAGTEIDADYLAKFILKDTFAAEDMRLENLISVYPYPDWLNNIENTCRFESEEIFASNPDLFVHFQEEFFQDLQKFEQIMCFRSIINLISQSDSNSNIIIHNEDTLIAEANKCGHNNKFTFPHLAFSFYVFGEQTLQSFRSQYCDLNLRNQGSEAARIQANQFGLIQIFHKAIEIKILRKIFNDAALLDAYLQFNISYLKSAEDQINEYIVSSEWAAETKKIQTLERRDKFRRLRRFEEMFAKILSAGGLR